MKNQSSTPGVHVGVFDHIAQADRAVQELVDAGFPKQQITVICPSCTHEKYQDFHKSEPAGSHAGASAAAGGAVGALLGGLVAVAGVVASGGTALLVAGPLLAGSGGGALFGGFVGAMMSRGMDREVADFYDQALQKNQILVAVELTKDVTAEQLATADRIFALSGTEHVTLRKA
jgi:hypothetical protein